MNLKWALILTITVCIIAGSCLILTSKLHNQNPVPKTLQESSMILRTLETGPLGVNCYIIGDTEAKEAMVVDPGGHVPNILNQLKADGLKCVMIVNTHTHWDHIGGNSELKAATGAPIVTSEAEAPMLTHAASQAKMFGMSVTDSPGADQMVNGGDKLKVGNIEFSIIELPGHSPMGIGLVFNDGDASYAIVGDALFAGSIGRTDFPGGDFELLTSKIRQNVFTLPEKTMVLPGHGPATTVEKEKKFNPFF